jgi:hypothetical protein
MRASNKRVTLGLDCESSSADARVESRPATNCPRSIACCSAARVEKNQRPSLHRGKTKKPTAHKQVRYRQPCCRGRSARAAGTRAHPADATRRSEDAAEKNASPPRQTSSSSSTAAVDPQGQPSLPSLWPPGDQADDRLGSVWMRPHTAAEDASRVLIRLPLLTMAPFLMPLDRTQNAARTCGCQRTSHDCRLT